MNRAQRRHPDRQEFATGHISPNAPLKGTLPIDSTISLNTLIQNFISTFGAENLYFTIVPFDTQGRDVGTSSTFGADNMEKSFNWLLMQTTKLASGSLGLVSVIARVIDKDTLVDHQGPHGPMKIWANDLYCFACYKHGIRGFDAAETLEINCTEHSTGELLQPENGVRYRSSKELLRSWAARKPHLLD